MNIDDIKKDEKIKEKFINGLNQLGFPLEFSIRRKLEKSGFYDVQEGYFSDRDKEGMEVLRQIDIKAIKSQKSKLINDMEVNFSLKLVGDCKYSHDKSKILIAIPDISNFKNKSIVGPLLSNFQNIIKYNFRNSYGISHFLNKFGDIKISSDVQATTTKHIIGNSKDKINEFEKIYYIAESQILPAIKEEFSFSRNFAFSNMQRAFEGITQPLEQKEVLMSNIKNHHFFGTLIIPFIITNKPIIIPIFDNNNVIYDYEEIGFTLYVHTVKHQNKYFEILNKSSNIGIFICNENKYDEFMKYILNIFNKHNEEIVETINTRPYSLYHVYRELIEIEEDINKNGDPRIV